MAKRWTSCTIVLMYFVLTVSMINMTKFIYVTWDFNYPMWMTSTHMLASLAFAYAGTHVFNMIPERREFTMRQKFVMVSPFSLCEAGSIASGNLALLYLYPSFHEMMQSTTAVLSLICSIVLVGKRYNSAAYVSMIPVTLGGALCTFGESSGFALFGLAMSLSAAVLRALRVILQAKLLQGQENVDSLTLLLCAAPFNLTLLLLGSLVTEGWGPWVEIWHVPIQGQAFMALTACTAALFNISAFMVVGHLGAVGSMVVANAKAPSVIVLSTLIFGNSCNIVQVLGFTLAVGGVFCFQVYGEERNFRAPTKQSLITSASVVGRSSSSLTKYDLENFLAVDTT